MFFLSPSGSSPWSSGSANFSIGSDSPVRAASWMRRLTLSTIRQSAGITLPVSSFTRSPGTRLRAFVSKMCPSRTTFTVGDDICFRAAMAFCARYSCKTPNTTNSTTIEKIAMASMGSPPSPLNRSANTPAISRITIITERTCSQRMCQTVCPPVSWSSFRPYFSRRKFASTVVRPPCDTPNSVNAVSSDIVCQSFSSGALLYGRAGWSVLIKKSFHQPFMGTVIRLDPFPECFA